LKEPRAESLTATKNGIVYLYFIDYILYQIFCKEEKLHVPENGTS